MKRLTLLLTALMLAPLSYAIDYAPYAALRIGYEEGREDHSSRGTQGPVSNFSGGGMTEHLALGTAINQNLRLEFEFTNKDLEETFDYSWNAQQAAEETTLKVEEQTYLFNIYYYPLRPTTFNLFLGAGLGMGSYKAEDMGRKNRLAYAFYLGVDHIVSSNIALEVVSTYNSILAPYESGCNAYNYGISVGVRYYI